MRRNVKENTGEERSKKARKTDEKRWLNDNQKRDKSPIVTGDHRDPCRWISPENSLFRVFFAFRVVWALWYFQNLIFETWNPSIFINITDLPSKSFDHHRTLQNRQPANQESVLSAQLIEKSTGHQTTKGSIGDYRKKNFKRRGAAHDSSSDLATN